MAAINSTRSHPSRRDVLRRGAAVGMGTAAALGGLGCAGVAPLPAHADGQVLGASLNGELQARRGKGPIRPGDLDVLRFLAAAELVEDDLWQQYCELAVNNPRFNSVLRKIDPSLVRYICDDRDDERSHANLINAYLASVGEDPINLDPFRTLPSVNVQGAQQIGRLTNLTALTVDTSWYNRYRSPLNPDFGATFPQVATIVNRPTIPTSDDLSITQLQAIAASALFHFNAIEQGGGSLYSTLLLHVTDIDPVRILSSIGPTEIYHFAAFHKSLEFQFAVDSGDGLVIPDLSSNRDVAEAIFPEPCTFLNASFPLCSVIRPTNVENAGAVAAATGLVNSGLFTGQSSAFLDAVVALATAADAARRTG